jgi:uncharacterized cupin superfamily protein/RimJ/RimL family protein N-acetyltransferase
MRPPFIGHYTDFLDEDCAHYPDSTELLSIGSAVGKKLGLVKIGIHIETLPPGRRTSYPHAESEEEEFAFVIDGTPDVWIDGELHRLRPGDFVAFPSGTGIAHTFMNNTTQTARLLVGGEATKVTNKIVYPLNDERNLVLKTQESLWENAPERTLGTHNGLPDVPKPDVWTLPDIETERLILREIRESDIPHIYAYASNPNVAYFVTWDAHKSLEETKTFYKFVKVSYLTRIPRFAVCLKENPDVMIGEVIGFWASQPNKVMEMGVVLHEDYWGRGIMTEALKELAKFIWENYDVNRIQAQCKKENIRSFKMLTKVGMTYEGRLNKIFYSKGQSWDMDMFSIVKS